MTIVVTGGASFIDSNFVIDWLAQSDEPVINLDALTYAGVLENLAAVDGDFWHIFIKSTGNGWRSGMGGKGGFWAIDAGLP